MTIEYKPKGVCSKKMIIDVEDGIVRSLQVSGGCQGNSQGVSRLIVDMPVQEAIRRLEGIRCGTKESSCPDQLAQALKTIED